MVLLLQEGIQLFTKYIDFQENDDTITFLYFLSTQAYDTFKYFPILKISGLHGCGKTKLCELIEALSIIKTINAIDVSMSSLFRFNNENKCIIILDDVEQLGNDSESVQDIKRILRGSYQKGKLVLREEKYKDTFVTKQFNVFGPKVVSSVGGLGNDAALWSRCVEIVLLRTADIKKAKLNVNSEDKELITFKGKIRQFIAEKRGEIETNYKEIYEQNTFPDIYGRIFDVWAPILSIAKIFGEEVLSQLSEHVRLLILDEQMAETINTKLLETLQELVIEDDYYNLKEQILKSLISSKFNNIAPSYLNEIYLGLCMKRLGFNEKRRVTQGVQYRLNPAIVRDRCKRYNVERLPMEKLSQKFLADTILIMCTREVDKDLVISTMKQKGFDEFTINRMIESLKNAGDLTEPKFGILLRCI